jgi:hypothetical protein
MFGSSVCEYVTSGSGSACEFGVGSVGSEIEAIVRYILLSIHYLYKIQVIYYFFIIIINIIIIIIV